MTEHERALIENLAPAHMTPQGFYDRCQEQAHLTGQDAYDVALRYVMGVILDD